MKNKSLKINAIFNVIRIAMSIIFPLITYPYASRVLGVDNIGKVQFATSVITFFSLLAALGVSSYAVRECSSIRNDRKKISEFASQIFTINFLFTIITYFLMFLVLLLPTKLKFYYILILIQSISLILTTLGVEWVFIIYEDYFYITLRVILTQVISLVLLFIFVRKEGDFYIYAMITVFASSITNIFNFFYSKKYIDLKLTKNMGIKTHLKPMFTLFSNNLAQHIYINSDVVMLGFFTNDFFVGIYTLSTKIYIIIKQLINAIIAVTIPRLSYLRDKNGEELKQKNNSILNVCILILFPAIIGLFLLSDRIVLLIGGKKFISGGISLKILSISLLFAVLSNFFVNATLIVHREDKKVLQATIIGAIANFSLNFIFIPLWQERGAAITTVISEATVFMVSLIASLKYVSFKNIFESLGQSTIGCILIFLIYTFIDKMSLPNYMILFLTIGASVIAYFILLLIFRNKYLIIILDSLKNKFNSITKRKKVIK